jgi:hypothetical protein
MLLVTAERSTTSAGFENSGGKFHRTVSLDKFSRSSQSTALLPQSVCRGSAIKSSTCEKGVQAVRKGRFQKCMRWHRKKIRAGRLARTACGRLL